MSIPDSMAIDPPGLLAQVDPNSAAQIDTSGVSPFFESLLSTLGPSLLSILKAIVILILFWIGATIVKAAIKGILSRTDLDNKIARWLTGSPRRSADFPIEEWASGFAYWLIVLLGLVAFLEALDLQFVSQPINNFIGLIFEYLPKLGGAALLLGVAWLMASLAKTLLVRGLSAFQLDDRLNTETGGESPILLNETLGNALYWFIFLLFLPAVLGALQLEGPLGPVQNLLDEILSALPQILEAVIIGAVGWLAARIVRGIVTNLLSAAGVDRVGESMGLGSSSGTMPLSGIVGTVVYIFILIGAATAAFDKLSIPALSDVLKTVLDSIPNILFATVILVVAYIIGRFVCQFVTNLLTNLGFNNILSILGLSMLSQEAPAADFEEGATAQTSSRTPSEFVGILAWIGIMLFGVIEAVDALQFEALSLIVAALLVILGQILAGLIVFAIGLYFANLAYRLIVSSGMSQAQFLGQAARVSIIILVGAMALQRIGIAPDIVNLAFGLLLGAIAVAIALAFGLGGRDVAAEQIRLFLASFKQKGGATPAAKAGRPAPRSNPEA